MHLTITNGLDQVDLTRPNSFPSMCPRLVAQKTGDLRRLARAFQRRVAAKLLELLHALPTARLPCRLGNGDTCAGLYHGPLSQKMVGKVEFHRMCLGL